MTHKTTYVRPKHSIITTAATTKHYLPQPISFEYLFLRKELFHMKVVIHALHSVLDTHTCPNYSNFSFHLQKGQVRWEDTEDGWILCWTGWSRILLRYSSIENQVVLSSGADLGGARDPGSTLTLNFEAQIVASAAQCRQNIACPPPLKQILDPHLVIVPVPGHYVSLCVSISVWIFSYCDKETRYQLSTEDESQYGDNRHALFWVMVWVFSVAKGISFLLHCKYSSSHRKWNIKQWTTLLQMCPHNLFCGLFTVVELMGFSPVANQK